MQTINAAGTVPWRHRQGALQVALVHRPRYDDWSWSKGKLEAGESWVVAAARETHEETGLRVALGMPLPDTSYRILDREGVPATKHVRYWAAQVVGGHGRLEHEIDELVWLDVASAHERLDYAHDREQLRAIQRAALAGTLTTRPLAIVRHALALPRGAWHREDPDRPLVAIGVDQAYHVAHVLAAYGIAVVESSPSERCMATVAPYAAAAGLQVSTRNRFSEEGFQDRGKRPVRKGVARLLAGGQPAALCSHGPVLPTILGELARHLADPTELAPGTEAVFTEVLDLGLDKGEVFVVHLVGQGEDTRIVAAERIAPNPS